MRVGKAPRRFRLRRSSSSSIEANLQRISENVDKCLMIVTALNPHIGYDKATNLAKTAHHKGLSLREANRELGYLTEEEFGKYLRPEKMTYPEAQ
jgi:fumarate hydratase class II